MPHCPQPPGYIAAVTLFRAGRLSEQFVSSHKLHLVRYNPILVNNWEHYSAFSSEHSTTLNLAQSDLECSQIEGCWNLKEYQH